MNNNDTIEAMEVLPPSSIEAIERAQVDVQVATAHRYPRDLVKFKNRALAMATLDEETAETCIYCRPVGKERDEKTGEMKQKFAEGPSIRLAEIVAASYGNIRVGARIVEQTDRFVRCEGVAHDLESNYAAKSEIVESTVDKNGRPYSERQRALTAKVALSKALRDATFRVVPRAMAKPILDAAKKVATGEGKPLVERRKRVQAWVGTLKIGDARVLAALSVKSWDETTDEHLATLTGIKNAISEGDTNIDEAFPPLEGASAGKAAAQTGFDKSAAKAPGKAQEQKGGATTPPEAQKSQGEAAAKPDAQPPSTATSPAQDEKALADAGLAPQQPQDQQPAPASEQAANLPEFKPVPGESEAYTSLRMQLHKSGVPEDQFMRWARNKKLAKEGQRLADLAEKKVLGVSQQWHNNVNEIKVS